jgi:predicted nicotinamide N-methyase
MANENDIASEEVTDLRGRRVQAREVRIDDAESLFIYESKDLDDIFEEAIRCHEPAPYGVILWSSAIGLARELRTMRSLAGATVLDLGTGNGLGALMAARMGAHVLAADIHPLSLAMVQLAAERQNFSDVRTMLFDIEGKDALPTCDMLIAADILYEPLLAKKVAFRCLEAIERNMSLVVANPDRVARDHFVEVLEEHGVPVSFESRWIEEKPDDPPSKIGVWKYGSFLFGNRHE